VIERTKMYDRMEKDQQTRGGKREREGDITWSKGKKQLVISRGGGKRVEWNVDRGMSS